MKIFAAIDVGSYELEMKIFEISKKTGINEIDSTRYQLDLGTDSYTGRKLSVEKVDELCRILGQFSQIMKTYKVDDYRAYGTSALRETVNYMMLLDQIELRTGIRIEIISNSEQRFLDYKAVACRGQQFDSLMESGTAIADLGGGSIQLSLFEGGKLTVTQNMKLGLLRIQDRLSHLDVSPKDLENMIDELISSQLGWFKKLYLKDRVISNLIIVDDYISEVVDKGQFADENRMVQYPEGGTLLKSMRNHSIGELSQLLGVAEENIPLTFIATVLVNRICLLMNISLVWIPGAALCDGIAYEYAEDSKLLVSPHNFEEDILSSARAISKRYMGSKKRSETLQKIALNIFDSTKKLHGLGKRERLLLQIATQLHDCGKYISLVNLAECSYNIILSTEIIGLSHKEREIVANVVKYNHIEFDSEEVRDSSYAIDQEAYLTIAKLTAILRLANGLDRSHKQKFKDVSITLKDDVLNILVDAGVDITLEKGLFYNRAHFFEEVYNVKPVITQKKHV